MGPQEFKLGDQLVGRGLELLVGHGIECVENEQSLGRAVGELRALSLSPVPSTAGDSGAVTPHHFSGSRMIDDRLTTGHSVERFLTGGP